jgi:hypothetical protein
MDNREYGDLLQGLCHVAACSLIFDNSAYVVK